MVDSVYIAGDYKSSKISTATIIKNPEMLRLVPDHLKTKNMSKYGVKKQTVVIKYVPDLYESQQMCDKAIPENSGTLEFCS